MVFLACVVGSLVIILGLGGLAVLALVGLSALIEKYGGKDK